MKSRDTTYSPAAMHALANYRRSQSNRVEIEFIDVNFQEIMSDPRQLAKSFGWCRESPKASAASDTNTHQLNLEKP